MNTLDLDRDGEVSAQEIQSALQ